MIPRTALFLALYLKSDLYGWLLSGCVCVQLTHRQVWMHYSCHTEGSISVAIKFQPKGPITQMLNEYKKDFN